MSRAEYSQQFFVKHPNSTMAQLEEDKGVHLTQKAAPAGAHVTFVVASILRKFIQSVWVGKLPLSQHAGKPI